MKPELLNKKCPEIMNQIFADLDTGFKVLGLENPQIPVKLYNAREEYPKKNNMFGQYTREYDTFSFYILSESLESESEKVNLSYVVWDTLRWWFTFDSRSKWRKYKILNPHITEEDIAGYLDYADSISWYCRPESHKCEHFYEQFAFTDRDAFAIMMIEKFHPQYAEVYRRYNTLSSERIAVLKERYWGKETEQRL